MKIRNGRMVIERSTVLEVMILIASKASAELAIASWRASFVVRILTKLPLCALLLVLEM